MSWRTLRSHRVVRMRDPLPAQHRRALDTGRGGDTDPVWSPQGCTRSPLRDGRGTRPRACETQARTARKGPLAAWATEDGPCWLPVPPTCLPVLP